MIKLISWLFNLQNLIYSFNSLLFIFKVKILCPFPSPPINILFKVCFSSKFFFNIYDYIVKIAERLLEIRKDRDTEKTHTIKNNPDQVRNDNAVKPNYKIIGNTPYKSIQDKAYLKYGSAFSKQIENSLNAAGIKFSGKVCDKLTTFTVNRQDLNTVRAIAAKEAERFTGINKPQIIPAQKQKTAGIKRQPQSNEMIL